MNFQIFLPMYTEFSFSRNVVLNKFSIPTSGDQFSVHLKQYSFILTFFSASGNSIFKKITLFPLVETDFLASGNHFFSSIFRHYCHHGDIILILYLHAASDSFIFPSKGNVFVIKSCILVNQNGFSG